MWMNAILMMISWSLIDWLIDDVTCVLLQLQIMEFFNVRDFEIPGYSLPHVVVELHAHLWSCAVVYHQWRWYCPRLWPCAWSMYLGWFKPRPPCVRRQFGVLLLATRGSIKWGAQVADIETSKASSGRELGRRCPRSLPTRRSGRNWEASVPVPSRLVDLGESWLRQPSPGRSLDHKTPFQQFLSVTESVRWKENAILLFIS